uniref:MICOS complex subunit MIC60 n=1 Tax=Otolemur garnettii TaxID=30611 RepID=H0XS02_OTOGA
MLRACQLSRMTATQRGLCRKSVLHPLRPCRRASTSGSSGVTAGRIAGAGLLLVGGGIGGAILYAKWDSHFRESVEKTIPYSDILFQVVLGSAPCNIKLPKKPNQSAPPLESCSVSEVTEESKRPDSQLQKQKRGRPSSTATEAAQIISAACDTLWVPAPAVQHGETGKGKPTPTSSSRERPPNEVGIHHAQQEKQEQVKLEYLGKKILNVLKE